MKSILSSLRKSLELTEKKLLGVQEEDNAKRPREDKWSAREILGHLIDSAGNNHRRFVLGQFSDDLVFPGYDQDAWVRVQNYQESSWLTLVALWKSYNLHIIHLVSQMPEDVLLKKRQNHNLDTIAWQTVPKKKSVTLLYFIEDYIGHMEHHLDQIKNMVNRI